jgi:hypothetical protein
MKYRLESYRQPSISSGCVLLFSPCSWPWRPSSPAQSGRHPGPIPGQTDKPIVRIETREVLCLSAHMTLMVTALATSSPKTCWSLKTARRERSRS